MKKTVIIIILIIIIIGAVGFSIYYWFKEPTVNENVNIVTNIPYANIAVDNEVVIMNASFNPSILTIKKGESVTWTNRDRYQRWVISDPHPQHDALPDLDSGKLLLNDSWSYTFNEVGEWGYHDELNPIKKGIIIVEE